MLLKLIAKDSDIVTKIANLTVFVLTHSYWRLKKTPLLVESYTWISQIINTIYTSKMLPCFSLEYSYLDNIPKTIITKNQICDNSEIIKKDFLKNISEKWSFYEHIYTDGSVLDGKTGCAFYHSNKKVSKKMRLPEYTSIYSAELWAIHEALIYCSEYTENTFFVIFSDSRSALARVDSCKVTAPDNYLINKILNVYLLVLQENKTVILVWVKAHVGIPENEIVDKLAKEATKLSFFVTNFKIPYTDFFRVAKARLKDGWQEQYNNSNKGLNYKLMFPCIPNKPWFCKAINKSFVRTISRIRSGHALYPQYKNKFGLQDHANCECGELGDSNHCILGCQSFILHQNLLRENLIKHIKSPFNLNHMLALDCMSIYLILYKYILGINIGLKKKEKNRVKKQTIKKKQKYIYKIKKKKIMTKKRSKKFQ